MIAGRYSLEREVGRGGMGVVWLAEDEVLGRPVALKRIGVQPSAESTDLARAEREARLAAQLSHPNVVAVFNLVVDPDTGDRWLVMEYVDGTSLAELVRDRGSIGPDEAAPLLRQAADALAFAHEAGIVHRDVKPSNILVDRDGQVKLTDFGIARTASDPSLTQTGLVTGSPAYLAPEVAAGGRGGEASDVWSLGATAFHVLSGRPPYDTADNLLGSLFRIVEEEPPRPPDAGWLAPLFEATMVKDVTHRWRMTEVRDFLAGGGRARPSPVPTPSASDSTDEPATQRLDTAAPGAPGRRASRTSVLVLAVVVVVAVLALASYVALSGDEPAADVAAPTRSAGTGGATASGEPESGGRPTAAGMRSFVRDYVATVSSDPAASWEMLTPKFQRESGGFETYQEFWSGVGDGKILALSADPQTLVVRYRVRFENFGSGRRPTVLVLELEDGRYRIAGERTEGFEPAG